VLAKVRQGEIDGELFRGWLDGALTRAADRALFDLPAGGPGRQFIDPANETV
jgi:hypothetical protein